ncbi:diacylglycerol kinase [Oikeobacillus pervagus]|uniref:Diacylglycerol kinase n=1 Tax=Oikeobacillus pervagus TaxID=1325931 RepID=A0AAJ1WJ98_9BACI|nr:diacylglycerol kinase family protein [Oikeobacillus pervagus]MDQ0213916.1 diacylglycerol kinase [Oikeobacillus pervagus]
MDLKDKRTFSLQRLKRSFSYALNGIKLAMGEPNFRIHLIASLWVILFGFIFSLTRVEWGIILLLIFGMFTLEMMNTAIERTVDMVTKEFHPLAKMAKDIAAGAVLLFAILSVILGMLIFIPKVMMYF